jgi:putative membrane protein
MWPIVIRVLITALAVLVAAKIVPGLRVRSFGSALIFAIVLGILAKILYAFLVVISLPFIVFSFGLFLLVINAFLFWLADKLVGGVKVDGFGSAFLGSLVMSLITMLAYWLLPI